MTIESCYKREVPRIFTDIQIFDEKSEAVFRH